MKWSKLKPFKKLVRSNGGSTAGRNSAGRITIFHRGGGAKRLQRKIDLKRSTSSMGIVERIEYDPNRSSRIALVRWVEGVQPDHNKISDNGFSPPIQKASEPITTTPAGKIPLACLAPLGGKITSVRDVFVSAFSSKGESLVNFPRMAVAGAKPAVFAPQTRDLVREGEKSFSLSDVRRWKKDSVLWEHRLKRKAAVSWSSFVREGPVGLASVVSDESKSKSLGKTLKNQSHGSECVPVTYILASNELEVGTTVMNCGRSKPPPHN